MTVHPGAKSEHLGGIDGASGEGYKRPCDGFMTSVMAGLSQWWTLYFWMSVFAACVCTILVILNPDRVEVEVGHELHPVVALFLFWCCAFTLWPIVVAVWLKSRNDDDGPWRG